MTNWTTAIVQKQLAIFARALPDCKTAAPLYIISRSRTLRAYTLYTHVKTSFSDSARKTLRRTWRANCRNKQRRGELPLIWKFNYRQKAAFCARYIRLCSSSSSPSGWEKEAGTRRRTTRRNLPIVPSARARAQMREWRNLPLFLTPFATPAERKSFCSLVFLALLLNYEWGATPAHTYIYIYTCRRRRRRKKWRGKYADAGDHSAGE